MAGVAQGGGKARFADQKELLWEPRGKDRARSSRDASHGGVELIQV